MKQCICICCHCLYGTICPCSVLETYSCRAIKPYTSMSRVYVLEILKLSCKCSELNPLNIYKILKPSCKCSELNHLNIYKIFKPLCKCSKLRPPCKLNPKPYYKCSKLNSTPFCIKNILNK